MVEIEEKLCQMWQEREKEQKKAYEHMKKAWNKCKKQKGKGETVIFRRHGETI